MTAIPESPFKGLAPFGDSPLDAQLFFGREREEETIVANVVASRMTVLFGPSGVGKSSLLRAGVAQALRELDGAAVVVHDAWAEEPGAALTASVRAACPDLGPTAGLVDTVAAAAQRAGQVYLLLDQFEDVFLYGGGPLLDELPELLRRPGLRVNVLLALRDDALAELDAFAGRMPDVFANLLRLDRLDRRAARAAVVGPLERYSELAGEAFAAEPELVGALLDEVTAGRVDLGQGTVDEEDDRIEAPFLQLVLERLWAEERATGSAELRLETLRAHGGAEPIVREHVLGALERLTAEQQDVAALVVRQLVTPSGAKLSQSAADLAEYAGGDVMPVLATLARERLLRVVEGLGGGPARYEIFHDVLAEPLLAWRSRYQLARERAVARRQRRRLLLLAAGALVALLVVAGIAIYALEQERSAHGRELAAEALAGLPTDPAASLALALRAAGLAPGKQTEEVLRQSLLASRERRVIQAGGNVRATFAPDGERLIVVGDAGARILDSDGNLVARLPSSERLTAVAWSSDGTMVATGNRRGTVTLWPALGGDPIDTIETHGPVVTLSYAGGELLVGSGTRIQVVIARGPRIPVGGTVVAAALSPDGRLAAVAAIRFGTITTRLIDARTGRRVAELRERGIRSLVFSPDGRVLATGSFDRTARLWDARNGRLLHVLPHRGHVLSERFSHKGSLLVTGSADGAARVWSVHTGERLLLLVGATGATEDASFRPNGKEVVVASADRSARIYSTEDGSLIATLAGHGDTVTSASYDATGRTIVTASVDGTARLWSAGGGNELIAIDRRAGPVRVGFARGSILTVALNEARFLDLQGHVVRSEIQGGAITAFAARGDTLITGGEDGMIRGAGDPAPLMGAPVEQLRLAARADAFVARSRDEVRVYVDGSAQPLILPLRASSVALDPAGRMLAVAVGRDVELRDARSGKLLHRLTGHRWLVTDAEFSPDGRRLVTASVDHDGRIWDVRTGQLLRVLRGHLLPVVSASFSPDGRWIVTASQITAGLWNADTGRLLLYLRGHSRRLTGAMFSPDGTLVLTGSEDGTARIFRCDICAGIPGLKRLARERLRAIQ